ncbi:MAG: molybdopterin biosynthesis protein MoeA [Synergistaceae bacterium]|nr:molybdopterin biosynthesis protein MoeA [Synergistaceae bacterium]
MALVKDALHIPLSRAWEILEESVYPLPSIRCPIRKGLDRILARDVIALRNVPHYNASAMDGYALCSDATSGALPSSPVQFEKGRFTWVNTGGEVPPPFDGVVMMEDAVLTEQGDLSIVKSLVSGENIRPLGEDVLSGSVIARKGDKVTPALSSLLAAAGVGEAEVLPLPRTLYIPTGNEIAELDEWLAMAPPPGTVGETNSLLVKGYFERWGFPLDVAPCLPDDPEKIGSFLEEQAPRYDMMLVSAGSAKGERDYTFTVFEERGIPLFRWLLMKPGRPAAAALLHGKPLINLPGFPMSTAVILWSVVFPALQLLSRGSFDHDKVLSEAALAPGSTEISLLQPYSSSRGKEEWVRFKCTEIDGKKRGYALPSAAGSLLPLAEADGLALFPLESAEKPKESLIPLMLLRDVPWKKRILFSGSNDPAFERIVTFVRKRGGDIILRSVGSMGGLASLFRRECHIAACHLLDGASGEYNTPFLEQLFGPGLPGICRRLLFYRLQGMILKKGNPKNIHSVEDLAREDISIINRQPGAGTRVLLDYFLSQKGMSPESIRGYDVQCATHFDAANRVALDFADVAFGIKSAADALGLDFLPLAEEPYELVYRTEYQEHPGIIALLEALGDREWCDEVDSMGGYRWPKE